MAALVFVQPPLGVTDAGGAEQAPTPATRYPRLGWGKGSITYFAPDFDATLDGFREYMK